MLAAVQGELQFTVNPRLKYQVTTNFRQVKSVYQGKSTKESNNVTELLLPRYSMNHLRLKAN